MKRNSRINNQNIVKKIYYKNKAGIQRLVMCLLFVIVILFLNMECVFLKYFNTPCLGCGMTRAWKALFTGHWQQAFEFHRAFWTVPIFLLYIFKGGFLFKKIYWDGILILLVLLVFVMNYIHHYI